MESEELADELGAIEAIYPGVLTKLGPLIYEFAVPQHEVVKIQMSFPASYPEEKPYIIQVASDKASRQIYDDNYLQSLFQEVLDSIFTEDMVCLFDFFSEIEAVLHADETDDSAVSDKGEDQTPEEIYQDNTDVEEVTKKVAKTKISGKEEPAKPAVNFMEGWIASEPITDRKSTFQAFIREVHSVDEAMDALELLKQDRKIMRSSHNMTAYRIKNGEVKYQDFDDDGESAAGGRMLHLLTIMDAWNCIVVVSRWFGGIHIGPDRFKHINSTTREAVVKSGLGGEDRNSKSKKKK